MIKFIFGLNGSVTSEETASVIAKHFSAGDEIKGSGAETDRENVPFNESFRKQIGILGKFPVCEINDLLSEIPLNPGICGFIRKNRDDCAIVTGNPCVWMEKLEKRIGCAVYSSACTTEDGRIKELTHILRKEDIVEKYQKEGYRTIFIGGRNSDAAAAKRANVSIAAGLTRRPAKSVLAVADYLVFSEEALCRQLCQLL